MQKWGDTTRTERLDGLMARWFLPPIGKGVKRTHTQQVDAVVIETKWRFGERECVVVAGTERLGKSRRWLG